MKIYVDELPKICKDCNCLNRVNGRCQLLHLYVDEDEKQEDCPLQTLADHDKKVRAEACERLGKIITKYLWKHSRPDMCDISSIIRQVMLENSQNTQKSSTGGENGR